MVAIGTTAPAPTPDRALLASRIQGFGNVNPPPLEEEDAKTAAKRAVGRLGDMLGEEVMLTVEDFKEKGAVGAVKDAVADAGDILIDGVSGIFGWLRGDSLEEEPNEAAEDAEKVLAHGPGGAAYGISQASPTGGINAVWIMPEDADPNMLAELRQQQPPPGVQPYAGSPGSSFAGVQPHVPPGLNIQPYQDPKTCVPGGPAIAPYSGPGTWTAPSTGFGAPQHASSFVPGLMPGAPIPRSAVGGSVHGSGSSQSTGVKSMVERIAKGDLVVGADLVKRAISQCTASNTSAQHLANLVCERARRLYLGLDGVDPSDTDASLARLLAFTGELSKSDSRLAQDASKNITSNISEELLSLQSSSKHRAAAEPCLRKLGLLTKVPEMEDLLGDSTSASLASAPVTDLLGGARPSVMQEVDLLGGSALTRKPTTTDDLLF